MRSSAAFYGLRRRRSGCLSNVGVCGESEPGVFRPIASLKRHPRARHSADVVGRVTQGIELLAARKIGVYATNRANLFEMLTYCRARA